MHMQENCRSQNCSETAPKLKGLSFQDLLLKLEQYWTSRDCILQQPYDVEVGAGTMHPETFLRVLGPDPYRVVYAQPSRRPADGRYGENPNRLYKHTQLQVILKPSPADIQDLYLREPRRRGNQSEGARHSVRGGQLGIADARRVGNWLAGAARRAGDHAVHLFSAERRVDLDPISVELTYGLDRIAAYLQGVDNVFDVRWSDTVTYGEVRLAEEQQFSAYSFDYADAVSTRKQFDLAEAEAARLLAEYREAEGPQRRRRFPILQAYDFALKCSHLFNLLDARGAISVTERAAMIGARAQAGDASGARRGSISALARRRCGRGDVA